MLWAFIPVAVLMTLTPGPGFATIVRNSVVGGARAGLLTIAGNSMGVVTWALLSALGVSALVAASEAAFVALKLIGGAVLVWLGIDALRRSRRGTPEAEPRARAGHPLRDGLVTSLANPKLAVFFVALFPQFVGERESVTATALAMAALIVAFDVLWYGSVAVAVSRARRALQNTRLATRVERLTGVVLVGLGLRVALESR